jgi:hypothetical protein
MGLKGSGKTKRLVSAIKEAAQSARGDVVCIEYDRKLTYDLPHKVRLVDSKEYGINNVDKLKGLLCGQQDDDYDITNVYIDNLYKTIGDDRAAGEEFLLWCAGFAEANLMEITVTVSDDPALASGEIKAFL